jgi:hypothetical protein
VDNYSIDGIIANDNEIVMFGIAKQVLDGTSCIGGIYTGRIEEEQEITQMSQDILNKLAKEGYRGYISIDFFKDSNSKIYFTEINTRYTALSAERMLSVKSEEEQSTIFDMELKAHKTQTIEGTIELEENISWYKEEFWVTNGSVHQNIPTISEYDLFQKRIEGFALEGQRPKGTKVNDSSLKIAKYVSVSYQNKTLKEFQIEAQKIKNQIFKSK